MNQPVDPLYMASRTALLDVLEALEAHRASLILVGAQAIYLRTASARTTVAPYTSDADLAVDPTDLQTAPALEGLLDGAGFTRDPTQPGQWSWSVVLAETTYTVPIDLMVPDALAGGRGRRSVLMPGHDRLVARRAVGLEACVVDKDPVTVAALEAGDQRKFIIQVAGPGALLVAKVHKIQERREDGRVGRDLNKDAADIYRLFQGISPVDMAIAVRRALAADVSAEVTAQALIWVSDLFGSRRAAGIEMVVQAGSGAEATIRDVCIGYTGALTRELG